MVSDQLERTRLLEPGLIPFVPGVERHRVCGGGVRVIALAPNDAIEITDREGRQRCELVVLGKGGGEDFGALSLSAGELATGLAAIINNGGDGYDVAKQAFKSGHIDFGEAQAAILFGEGSPAGETVLFNAERPCLCIIAAPGGPMRVDMQDPPTEIKVMIKRAQFDIAMERPLPPPLADPRLDFRIPKATAQAYEIKAGEYIQVIDVDGRECSDFQAFHRADLDRGIQRDIDPTVTRYVLGALYPGPGLFSKFYDANLRPLLEVVRDTVGRHDTFGLACNAKYYDDMGYPGHVNCTDNFNAALAPYEISPHQGWVAINFFYNTTADSMSNHISFAEPWSRPGDYVLLRHGE